MHATIVTLCEFATIDVTGRLNLSGIFSMWNINQFPSTVTRFYIAAQIGADYASERDQSGRHLVKVRCVRSLPPNIVEEQIFNTEIPIELAKSPNIGQLPRYIPIYWPIYFAIDGMTLPGPGLYSFNISYRDTEVATIQIGARHVPVVKK